MTFDVNKLDDEQKAAFDEAVEKAVKERLAAEGGGDGADDVNLDDVPEPVAKAMASMSEALEKAQQRAESAEEAINKMREEQERARYIRKAAQLGLPGTTADDFGEILRKAEANLTEEERETFEETLRTAGAAAAAAMEELGAGGHGTTSVEEEVEALAKKLQEEDPTLTADVAKAKVWDSRPDLYKRYRQEAASARKEI